MQAPNGQHPSRDQIIAEQISRWWFANLSEEAVAGGENRALLRNGADAVVVTSTLMQEFIHRFSGALEDAPHLEQRPLSFGEFEALLPWMRAIATLRHDGQQTVSVSQALADIKSSYTSAKIDNLLGCDTQAEFCATFARLIPMMENSLSVRDATTTYLGWRFPEQRRRLAYDVLMKWTKKPDATEDQSS